MLQEILQLYLPVAFPTLEQELVLVLKVLE
nr:MAG TPA: hypothetical protein [Caudoviricetes sp.]